MLDIWDGSSLKYMAGKESTLIQNSKLGFQFTSSARLK